MADLTELRKHIDAIDNQMVELFENRMSISKEVAEYKIQTNKAVFDKEREKQKLAKLKELAHNDFNRYGIEELFQQIMAMSRKLQYQLLVESGKSPEIPFRPIKGIDKMHSKVIYQGVKGAYSYAAMKQYFGEQTAGESVSTWKDAMEIITRGEADYAVLPIENSTAGSVIDMYDLLVDYDNSIIGEHIINADHALMGLQEAKLPDIKKVLSHQQGLSQCKLFLDEHREWEQIPVLNTAGAAKKVMEDGDITQAAIASKHAAEVYGLKILRDKITSSINSTRFIIVTRDKVYIEGAGKISICFELAHESGTLYNILSHFIYNNLSMTKIESRPIAGKNWEYRFFIDFEGSLTDSAVKNALKGIKEEAIEFKILGNY